MSGEPNNFDDALAAACAGDGSGFDWLYNSLSGRVTGFAVGRGADDPEGITNEVFIKTFRTIATFEGDETAFTSWVFSIARNQLIDAQRAAQRRPQRSDRQVAAGALVVASAESSAIARLGNVRVDEMLACLTSDQRDVITLRIVADLSLLEVARIIDKPISAVKRLQSRGLKRLQREILDKEVS